MVVSALVPKEGDGVLGQGDHLVGARVGHRGIIHRFVHGQARSGRAGGSVRVYDSQASRRREECDQGGLGKRSQSERTEKYQGSRGTKW